ncbi:DNA polymerase III, chi subunit [Sphingomonas guangdongensis]|uniref:DNA polymerase III, chi subunit n=1 Tax=Sphingomonas guangdongensis TaxID=1141890 RepID=A0A285R098_9SPHN|nr:DNA polymerase III subunit chi [Sphingomonas guangdongensis]SOB87546.1 DNA polymerase III, chi subunit [Sphingomonas guangdongensis]
MQVDFYHLVASPLERVLPRIAERVVAGGDRLLVVAGDEAQRASLDRLLWTYAPDSFLPHARAGGEHDADQPILIAADTAAPNGARHVALVDGVWREEALGFDRAFHFFDGDSVGAARAAWKALGEREGVERRYWKQDDTGRWTQAA